MLWKTEPLLMRQNVSDFQATKQDMRVGRHKSLFKQQDDSNFELCLFYSFSTAVEP